MREPIYFSKFMIQYSYFQKHYRIQCNVLSKELSYEMYETKFIRSGEKLISGTEKILFQDGIHLTDEDIESLKPYINAWEFETYRDKKPWDDRGSVIGYFDGPHMTFEAISGSHLPLLKLDMTYFFEPKWPTEKLDDYLYDTFIKTKRLKAKYYHDLPD